MAQAQEAQAQVIRVDDKIVFMLETRDRRVFTGKCEYRVVKVVEHLSIDIPPELGSLKIIAVGESSGDADTLYTEMLAEDVDENKYYVLIKTEESGRMISNAITCANQYGTFLELAQPLYKDSVTIMVTVKPLAEAMAENEWSDEDIKELFDEVNEPWTLVKYLLDEISEYLPEDIKEDVTKDDP